VADAPRRQSETEWERDQAARDRRGQEIPPRNAFPHGNQHEEDRAEPDCSQYGHAMEHETESVAPSLRARTNFWLSRVEAQVGKRIENESRHVRRPRLHGPISAAADACLLVAG